MTKDESPIVFLRVSELAFELKMAREEEREACAKVCDDSAAHYWAKQDTVEAVISEECATAIRARGNK